MPGSDVEEAALGVLISQVGDMREDIREMRTDLKAMSEDKVSYREWSQRNAEVNGRFTSQGREIGELRLEIRSKSAPWWSVGSLIVSIVAIGYTILNP